MVVKNFFRKIGKTIGLCALATLISYGCAKASEIELGRRFVEGKTPATYLAISGKHKYGPLLFKAKAEKAYKLPPQAQAIMFYPLKKDCGFFLSEKTSLDSKLDPKTYITSLGIYKNIGKLTISLMEDWMSIPDKSFKTTFTTVHFKYKLNKSHYLNLQTTIPNKKNDPFLAKLGISYDF